MENNVDLINFARCSEHRWVTQRSKTRKQINAGPFSAAIKTGCGLAKESELDA